MSGFFLTPRKYIAHLNNDGSIDTTFTPPEFNRVVYDVILQPDGKILACGDFTAPAKYLIRLNPDGTIDTQP